MKSLSRAWPIGVLSLLLGTVAWAQATAQLGGRVTDQSGAILPGVSVTATQTDTGLSRTVVTDGEGAYQITNLPTGPYRLEVMCRIRSLSPDGSVQVDAKAVVNASIKVGALAETVQSKLLHDGDGGFR